MRIGQQYIYAQLYFEVTCKIFSVNTENFQIYTACVKCFSQSVADYANEIVVFPKYFSKDSMQTLSEI